MCLVKTRLGSQPISRIEILQIAQPTIGFAVVHQVLDIIVRAGPSEAIALLGMYNHLSYIVQTAGIWGLSAGDIAAGKRIASIIEGIGQRKKCPGISVSGIRMMIALRIRIGHRRLGASGAYIEVINRTVDAPFVWPAYLVPVPFHPVLDIGVIG